MRYRGETDETRCDIVARSIRVEENSGQFEYVSFLLGAEAGSRTQCSEGIFQCTMWTMFHPRDGVHLARALHFSCCAIVIGGFSGGKGTHLAD